MSNNISSQLLAELYGQQSGDPLLMLVTLEHPSFGSPIYLVSNTENIVSRGNTHTAFPMEIRLPADDGESSREVSIEFDNVSLELIDELRSITSPIEAKVELVLASDPDTVQLAYEELKIRQVTYNKQRISAKLYLDSFLNVQLTSESYGPTNFPGLF
jgi:hypothetical protein